MPMQMAVISIFPEMCQAIASQGVLSRAAQQGELQLSLINPRDFAADRHATVDDRPYGGGPGMVMKAAPLARAIEAARALMSGPQRLIYLSPQGAVLDQARVEALAARVLAGEGLIFLAGRYEGVDERLLAEAVDEELSIGDYVLTGGELPAMVVIDAIARYLPGTLGNAESVVAESHVAGLLDCPHYTRPELYQGQQVPPVLISGDHGAVMRWRLQMALARTYERRPDLLVRRPLSADERRLLTEYLAERQQGLLDDRSGWDA